MRFNCFFPMFFLCVVFGYEEFQDIKIEDEFYSATVPYKNIFTSKDGLIEIKETTPRTLSLICFGPLKFEDVIKPFKEMVSYTRVAIRECKIPPTPIVQLLKSINVNTTAMEMFIMTAENIISLPPGNYTEGLNVKSLWIQEEYTEPRQGYLKDNLRFLNPVENLTTLILKGIKVPLIPQSTRLEVLSLEKAAIARWGNCQHLRELSIVKAEPGDLPTHWPHDCVQLTAIRTKDNSYRTMINLEYSGIGSASTNLRSLDMKFCNLLKLPITFLQVAKNLERLILSNNKLSDNSLLEFPRLESLTRLDLSGNHLSGWSLFDLAKQVPSLRYLNLDGNRFFNLFCNYETRIHSFTSHLANLEELSLNKMTFHPDCFEKAHFTKLQKLNLSAPDEIKEITIKKFPKTNATHLEIDLRGRFIKSVKYGYRDKFEDSNQAHLEIDFRGRLKSVKHEYEDFEDSYEYHNKSKGWNINNEHRKTNVTLLMSKIDCECNNYWFALTLRERPDFMTVKGLKCQKSGRDFYKEPMETMNCETLSDDGRCKYKYLGRYSEPDTIWGYPRAVSMECHNPTGKLISFEVVSSYRYKTVSLNLTDNGITSLKRVNFGDSLEWVDLRRNSMSRLDDADLKNLFKYPNRRVWLSRNLFICDCANKLMLDAFHAHHNQIVDFDELICIESGLPLISVTSYEVCHEELRMALSISVPLAALVLIILVVLWCYRLPIKIYLYSRGLCLSCVREEDIDSDKPFDAFLSFAQGDIEYVVEELLPKLESEPNSFSVCVHYRDWVVGHWIPDQIMRSVSLSKRTIILLSRNFISSMWASLEFRYAMASATQEGRTRLIVLILDDVLSEPLEAELQTYITYNTYLRCDDPYFWDKLRYAMPHRMRLPKPVENVNKPMEKPAEKENSEVELEITLPEQAGKGISQNYVGGIAIVATVLAGGLVIAVKTLLPVY